MHGKKTAYPEEVHSTASERRPLLHKNNVRIYDWFECNVFRHKTTTHAAYKIMAIPMQSIQHCIAVESGFSSNCMLNQSVLSLSAPYRGSPGRAQ